MRPGRDFNVLSSSCPDISSLWDFSPDNEDLKIHDIYEKRTSSNRSKKKPFIIGVSGGTASGKTSVCDIILENLAILSSKKRRVWIISQDSFYKTLNEEELKRAHKQDYNFDHPDAFDWDLIKKVFLDLSNGRPLEVPHYDFVTHSRTQERTFIHSPDIVVFEGILAFYDESVRNLMDMKLFVDTDADIRLARRVVRDIQSRGRDLESVLNQYERFVKPAFNDYVLPTKKFADVIIPRGKDNKVAINLIVQHIQLKLIQNIRSSQNKKKIEIFTFLQREIGTKESLEFGA